MWKGIGKIIEMWIDLLNAAGIFCLCYFAFIMLYVGPRPSFHYIWLAGGILLKGTSWCMEQGKWTLIPEELRFLITVVITVGLLILLIMETQIFSKMWVTPGEEVHYVIVLGACVRGTRVTSSLSYRLKKASSYAKKHKDCMLVVSGGQGPGEDITEALAMSRYLQNLGIPAKRILLEDKSVNTRENLIFSRKIIFRHEEEQEKNYPKEEELTIAVCSNNFHMYRAMALARSVGTWKVHGLAAITDPFMWLSFTLREGIALFKELLFGHVSWR